MVRAPALKRLQIKACGEDGNWNGRASNSIVNNRREEGIWDHY